MRNQSSGNQISRISVQHRPENLGSRLFPNMYSVLILDIGKGFEERDAASGFEWDDNISAQVRETCTLPVLENDK